MKMRILLLYFMWYTTMLHSAPVTSYFKLNTAQCKTISSKTYKKIRQTIQKNPLRYLNLSDECTVVHGSYIGLRPSTGPSEGKEMQFVVIENKEHKSCDIFIREKLCDNCVFSSWRKIKTLEYSMKAYKKKGLIVCSDGTIHSKKLYRKHP